MDNCNCLVDSYSRKEPTIFLLLQKVPITGIVRPLRLELRPKFPVSLLSFDQAGPKETFLVLCVFGVDSRLDARKSMNLSVCTSDSPRGQT